MLPRGLVRFPPCLRLVMAPANYSGSLEPKHAGEMLAKVRRAGVSRHFTDADRERAFALHSKALAAHDAALGKLMAHVRMIGRDVDTTLIVTGDVGVDAAAHAPFLEEDSLDETALAVPLVVRVPGTPTRPRVAAPTSSVDVARTALDALGLVPPPQLRGESIWPMAQRAAAPGAERPRLATTTTRFAARWGPFVLSGTRDRETKLCSLALEPTCVSDVRSTHPLAAEMLHAAVFDELFVQRRGGEGGGAGIAGAAGAAAPAAAPANVAPAVLGPTKVTPDAPTLVGLRAWGR